VETSCNWCSARRNCASANGLYCTTSDGSALTLLQQDRPPHQEEEESLALTPELTVEWWKWFLGENDQRQREQSDSYPTIFFGSSKQMIPDDKEVLNAYSTVRRDQGILISIDKWISLGIVGLTPDDLLMETAKERIDSLVRMEVSIDKQPQRGIRMMSPVFEIDLKHDILKPEVGPKKIKKGRYKAVTDGYWLFLKPGTLDVGEHTIETFGACRTERLSLSVCHHLTVVEEGRS
jgi:hypothetical protein